MKRWYKEEGIIREGKEIFKIDIDVELFLLFFFLSFNRV